MPKRKHDREHNDDDYAFYLEHKDEIHQIIRQKRAELKAEAEARAQPKQAQALDPEEKHRQWQERREKEKLRIMGNVEMIIGEADAETYFQEISLLHGFLDVCYQFWYHCTEYLGKLVVIQLTPLEAHGKQEFFLLCLSNAIENEPQLDTKLTLCAKLVDAKHGKKKWQNLTNTELQVSDAVQNYTSDLMHSILVKIQDPKKSYTLKQIPLFLYDCRDQCIRISDSNQTGNKAEIVLVKQQHKPTRSPEYSDQEDEMEDDISPPRTPTTSPPPPPSP